MKTYPICLVGLDRRRAVVVGGGKVAERKTAGLIEAGAQVTVISPTLTGALRSWAAAGAIAIVERTYRMGDLAGAFLVVAATRDPDVNLAVCQEAERHGCLLNSVETPERGNYIAPSVIRRGNITLAIGTGGTSPALARCLRIMLEEMIGPEYAGLASLLAELRPSLDGDAGREAAGRLLRSRVLEIMRAEGAQAAACYARELLGAGGVRDQENLATTKAN
jgi:precorrin-2 dehydrogenase/sirohydrochlorin ferrochelatase